MTMADARVTPRLRRWLGGLLTGAVLIGAASGLVALLEPYVPQLVGLPPVYLLAVLPVAIGWGAGPGVTVAVASIAAFEFLFVPPRWSLAVADARYGVTLGFFLLTAVTVAWLAGRSRRDEQESARLSQEQAGLRRVATLVANAARPHEVFAAVSDEIARLLEPDLTTLVRFESDGSATFLAGGGWRGRGMQVGRTMPVPPSLVPLRDGEVVRIDDLRQRPDMTETVEKQGLLGVVGCPIVVEGRVWGAFGVGSRAGGFPAATEQRLVDFTELIGTAIANAESRAQVTRLLDVQAALHRVATLVASEAAPDEVVPAVSDEIRLVLDSDATLVTRVDPDGLCTIIAQHGPHPAELRVGKRWAPDPGLAMAEAVRTGRPAFRESYPGLDEVGEELIRTMGVQHSIALPIIVDGRVWGAVGIARTRDERFPPDVAQRVMGFAELLSTAVRNTENRAQTHRLLEEQAALRRVATVVARGAPAEEVFAAAADEVAGMLGADVAILYRLGREPGRVATLMGASGWAGCPVGAEFPTTPELVEVLEGGGTVRLDDISVSPSRAAALEGSGIRAVVACAVTVEGRLWGVFSAGSRRGPLPGSTERRLVDFAELVGTAVANAESRAEVLRLLSEQRALSRVATLVATGPTSTEVSRAVAEEVRGLLGADDAGVCRYEADGTAVLLVGIGDNLGEWQPGTHWPLDDVDSTSEVWRTGRSARFDADRWERASGPVAARLRQMGVHSVVASPVTVDGRLWGAVMAWSSGTSLPADTEQRMARFTELVAMAIGNAENQAQLAASRTRVVAASDEARRRIERNLHDGAQQRIVALGLELRLAQERVPEELPEVRAGLGRVADDLGDVLDELREMARGIHPAMLSEGGLRTALATLARRAPVPVELDIATYARFPELVEVAAYYVVSESLTNAVKHAEASHITVSLAAGDGLLRLSVRDDGVGGADPQGGSGLIGLRDRVEALGGRIAVESPRGAGTRVLVTLPVDAASAPLTVSPGR
jgi:signal transduction histidine kinase